MKKLPILLLLFCVVSCQFFDSLMHDEDPIARVGDSKLYYSDIRDNIPEFLSPEDSAAMVQRYVTKWATSLLFEELAEKQLSDDALDVEKELQDYYRSLLRYRYEQQYVNERLDTVVTDEQIQDYYNLNSNEFALERPVLKVRFAVFPGKFQGKSEIVEKMLSADGDDAAQLENEVREYAVKYKDLSEKWTDAAVLAREFGTDWVTMMDNRSGDIISIRYEQGGDTRVAVICDEVLSGPAPLEYCSNLVRDIILSVRKHTMLEDLENNVMEDARKRRHFKIYGK